MPAFDQGQGARASLDGVAEPVAPVALPEHGARVKAGATTADPKHVRSTFDDFRGVDITQVGNGEDDLVTVSPAALLPEHPTRFVNETQVLQARVTFKLIHEVLCGVVTQVNRDIEEAYAGETKLGHEVRPDAKGGRENVSVAHDFCRVRAAAKDEDKVCRDHHLVQTPSPSEEGQAGAASSVQCMLKVADDHVRPGKGDAVSIDVFAVPCDSPF
jgi:hypothetical protein